MPFTQIPLANQWEINVYMMNLTQTKDIIYDFSFSNHSFKNYDLKSSNLLVRNLEKNCPLKCKHLHFRGLKI